MSELEAAKARFLSPASGATRTDSYHICIEIGSGEPASFQVPKGPPTVHFPGMVVASCRIFYASLDCVPEGVMLKAKADDYIARQDYRTT